MTAVTHSEEQLSSGNLHRRGQDVNLSIFYNIWNSWRQIFHGFDFSFRWRNSENQQLANNVDSMTAHYFYDP